MEFFENGSALGKLKIEVRKEILMEILMVWNFTFKLVYLIGSSERPINGDLAGLLYGLS